MEIDGYEITGMYLGDQEISNAYVGDKEVFSKAPSTPLYAAYHFPSGSAEQNWVYAKYPLDGSRVAYYSTNNMVKVSSSSQFTGQAPNMRTATEEYVEIGDTSMSLPYYRDRSADLYS